jgi:hypothetical protein
MPGIGDQDIYISPVGFVKRAVYDIRSDEEWNIKTGHVMYGNNVAVWRPYDTKNITMNSYWGENTWLPIYTTELSFDPDFDYQQSETYWHSVDDSFLVKLPTTRSTITSVLKNHLVSIHKSNLANSKFEMDEWRSRMGLNNDPALGSDSED